MGLRIGFDAKRFFHNQTGLGNYSRTLIRNLAQYYPDFQLFLFTPSRTNIDCIDPSPVMTDLCGWAHLFIGC